MCDDGMRKYFHGNQDFLSPPPWQQNACHEISPQTPRQPITLGKKLFFIKFELKYLNPRRENYGWKISDSNCDES